MAIDDSHGFDEDDRDVDDAKVIPISKRRRRERQEPPSNVIKISADVHRVADECSRALLRCPNVYCRGGELVRVVRDGAPPPGVSRRPGTPTIRPLPNPTLTEELTRVQPFVKFDRRSESWMATVPPPAIVAAVAARGSWPGMRPLRGILEAPSIRPDGSVLQTPGYDAATQYLYEPSDDFPRVPERPSREDALRARDALLEVVCDFPFPSDEYRSAWLASSLTLVARPAIEGCVPAMLYDGNNAGAGKGRAVDAAANLGTGRDATKTPLPQDDDELRKRITALLLQGERIGVLDNVTDTIALPSLDAVLTATVWSDRLLGANANATIENQMIWCITGNNVALGGDLARRVLHIRLESPLENPENRSGFRHDPLLPWVRAERPRLVVAALTLLRAHAVAGRPRCGVKAWGSYESWSEVIASAVAWVDMPDPQRTRLGLTSSVDATKLAQRGLLEGWARLTRDLPDGLTVKRAVEVLYSQDRLRGEAAPDGYDDLREAIETLVPTLAGKAPSASKLGAKMREMRRRVHGARCLDGSTDRNGIVRWLVRAAGDAGDAGAVPNPTRGSGSDKSGEAGGNQPCKPRIPRTEGGAA